LATANFTPSASTAARTSCTRPAAQHADRSLAGVARVGRSSAKYPIRTATTEVEVLAAAAHAPNASPRPFVASTGCWYGAGHQLVTASCAAERDAMQAAG
jgi:hypothetical protein